MDYRLIQNRKEAFANWYYWSLKYKDCDPAIWLLNYLFGRFEHNLEQKYWIAWIYGTTYHLPTAWVIWNEFPDFELVDYDRLKYWNDKNYSRLRYQTDTKYNKGYLPQQFASYKKWINHNNPSGTQRDKFYIYKRKNSFNYLFQSIAQNLYKFGRYSTWFYMQTLKQCVDINLEPASLKLEDFSGSKSHRNGLCYAVGKDEWINQKLSQDAIVYLNEQAQYFQNKMNYMGAKTDLYNLETVLCSFKKIFRKTNGRYLGYYLDRQAEEIKKVEKDGWVGVDWQVFWDGRKESLNDKLYISENIDKSLYPQFLETGNFMREECPI
tara:strand:- start:961 stop:1929 length:969 start_codon:yes stop_codon:yes gene_type:complete